MPTSWWCNPYIVALLKTTTLIDFIHPSKSSATKWTFENYTYQNHSTAGDNIGITSSTCRHYTLSNSIMCNDSYPSLSCLLFLYHPYIPHFLIQRIFHFLVELVPGHKIGKEWVERIPHKKGNRSLLHNLHRKQDLSLLCVLIIEAESSCAFAYINTTEISLFDAGVGQ